MGMGMLFAGALTGGAQAAGQIADEQIKRNERAEVRQQSLMDRRNELLFEMKAKADYARGEEERAAAVSNKIAERGQQIGNERGARELESARSMVPNEGPYANTPVSPADLASMPPAARAIYEKQMGLTDDSPLQAAKDQITASTEIGAPASVKKGLLDTYKEEVKQDKDRKTLEFGERKLESQERMRMESEDRKDERQNQRLEALIDKANAKGGGKDGAREVLSFLGESRKSIAQEEANLRAAMKAEMEAARTPAKQEAVKKSYAPQLAEQAQKREALEKDFAFVRQKIGLASEGASPAQSSPSPSGAQSVKPANSSMSGDAKAERMLYLQAELKKAEQEGKLDDVEALKREIIRDGGVPGASAQTTAAKPAPTAPSGKFSVGQEQTILSGPHAGKKAVYDGKGWKLKG